MSDAGGNIIGIRVRTADARKYCVTGSKTGLFIPQRLTDEGPLLVCEGNTDTAAGLTLGFDCVGRPSALAGTAKLMRFCHGRDTVVIADNDPKADETCPGIDGANRLATKLVFVCPTVKVVLAPIACKDLRSWLIAGLEHQQLKDIIDGTEPVRLEYAT